VAPENPRDKQITPMAQIKGLLAVTKNAGDFEDAGMQCPNPFASGEVNLKKPAMGVAPPGM
jgi:hypothetical protein